MNRVSHTLAACLAALSLTALAACAPPAPPIDPTGDDLQAALDALVERADGPVGIITVVDDGGAVTVRSAGQRALGTGVAPSATDHMRIASLSKALTAATAYTLVDDGVLELTDTIGDWRPDLPLAWHPITLRQLLTHTSGVPDFAVPAFFAAVGASPDVASPPAEILGFAGTGTVFDPGDKYTYSNSNPFVTALIIESATGENFADVLSERVLLPLGMSDTSLPATTPNVPSPRMEGYQPFTDGTLENVTEQINFGGWAWASGGVVSTPADLTKFIRGYVGGDLYSGALRDEQFRFVVPGNSEPRGPGDNSAGAGLFRYRTRCGTVYGHTGSITGYTQFMASTRDGSKSVTFTITNQYGAELLPDLRAAEELAVCAALGR